ncbi:MAG: T9SS type A sorting domain-containing protein [Melioribacteraceae bacterium]
MKKVCITLFLFVSVLSFAQTNENLEFYPINTNNYFEYVSSSAGDWFTPGVSSYYSISVKGDTVLSNGKTYKILVKNTIPQTKTMLIFERLDTVSGYVYRYNDKYKFENNEYKYDYLNGKDGEFLNCSRRELSNPIPTFRTIFRKDGVEQLFGLTIQIKEYDDYSTMPALHYKLAKGFGFYSRQICEGGCSSEYLVYAVVNGVSYGTKIIVNVEKEEIPVSFSLSQNYPNPFNPETTISYKVQAASKVSLKVYDLLGREVATLVDQYKQPGSYTVAFNVKTRHGVSLQSGVYFYRLQAGSFSETKKMILLK